MAKKKVNKRRDYNLGSRDVIVYGKSSIPRQMLFMILRGPGLIGRDVIEETAEMKAYAIKKRIKLKFMSATTATAFIAHLADANTWATAVIYNKGSLKDESGFIQKKMDRLLIPTLEISANGKVTSMLDGLEKLSKN